MAEPAWTCLCSDMNCGGGPGLPGWLHKYNTETDGRVCERQLKGKNGDGFILGSMLYLSGQKKDV